MLLTTGIYQLSRRRPELDEGAASARASRRSCPTGYDVDTHFKPRYNPWDQRLCLVPDGDLFQAIRGGTGVGRHRHDRHASPRRASGWPSGAELEADVVVTATGLNLLALGGIDLAVDGEQVDLPDTMAYKGMMLSGVPNFAFTIGYTNASWTLKADLVSEYVCRLLEHMGRDGSTCVRAGARPGR